MRLWWPTLRAVIAANAGAAALVAAPEAGEARQLEILMARAARDSATFAHRIDLPGDIAGRAFETTLLPFGKADDGANYVLVLARDTTLDRSFTNALIASRRLFQGYVQLRLAPGRARIYRGRA